MDEWGRHQLLVLKNLSNLDESVKQLSEELHAHRLETMEKLAKLRINAAVNKVKASAYGTMGGALAIFVDIFVKWYTHLK